MPAYLILHESLPQLFIASLNHSNLMVVKRSKRWAAVFISVCHFILSTVSGLCSVYSDQRKNDWLRFRSPLFSFFFNFLSDHQAPERIQCVLVSWRNGK